jgi:25S rRNA (uracil2634-N3)-methyltransferase
LRAFFRNAGGLLRADGEIHVSHKTGHPYDRWEIEQLASESSLVMFKKEPFWQFEYPGYNQKRGAGARCDENFPISGSVTYKFSIERNEDDESTPIHLTVALDLMKLEAVTSTA